MMTEQTDIIQPRREAPKLAEMYAFNQFTQASNEQLLTMRAIAQKDLARGKATIPDRFGSQRKYEDITMEMFFRAKGEEGEKLRQEFYEWNNMQSKRVDSFLESQKRMEEKYGEAYQPHVQEDEWYKVAPLTEAEQKAYERHMEIRKEVKELPEETFDVLKELGETNNPQLTNFDFFKEVEREIPGLTKEKIEKIQENPEYIIFGFTAMFAYFSMIFSLPKDADKALINAKNLEFAQKWTPRAIEVIKGILAKKGQREKATFPQKENTAGNEEHNAQPVKGEKTAKHHGNKMQPPSEATDRKLQKVRSALKAAAIPAQPQQNLDM